MKLRQHRFTIHPRVPFAISRSSTTAYERVLVRLSDGEFEGIGEAAPNVYYGESADTVEKALGKLDGVLRNARVDSLEDIAALEQRLANEIPDAHSARAAVSTAAHDMLGRRQRRPLWELFGADPASAPPSSFTIAISSDDADIRRRVEEAERFPILKIKLGSDRDEWIVRTIRRSAPRKTMRADANAAWDVATTERMAKFLADEGFDLLEQPLARDDLAGYRKLHGRLPLPVIADESCMTARDIPALDGAVDGINIKLSKCGGLAEARRMIADARARGLRIMLGCMIESSVGITAAAHLAPLVDYADLDGAALLRDDPFQGARIDDGVIRLPSGPGLGVTA